jgi:hypothetical protein
VGEASSVEIDSEALSPAIVAVCHAAVREKARGRGWVVAACARRSPRLLI